MNILISGGAKNGKSYYAQRLARQMAESGAAEECDERNTDGAPEKRGDKKTRSAAGECDERKASNAAGCLRPLYYIATMIPHDEEDRARIRRHIAERAGWGFTTVEQGRDLTALLQPREAGTMKPLETGPPERILPDASAEKTSEEPPADGPGEDVFIDPAGVFLLDSVTALLSNEMFRPDGSMDPQAAERVAADCTAFAKATGRTVFVSDYIYGDADRYDTMTEEYRRGLALVDRALARVCDRVIEVSAGTIEEWKSPIGDMGE